MTLPVDMDRVAEQQAARLPLLSLAVERIAVAAAVLFQVTPADVLGRGRSKSHLEARLVAYYVARRCTRMSYPELGRAFGRDHTTVLTGVQRMGSLMARDAWLGAAVAELLEQFGEAEEREREQ